MPALVFILLYSGTTNRSGRAPGLQYYGSGGSEGRRAASGLIRSGRRRIGSATISTSTSTIARATITTTPPGLAEEPHVMASLIPLDPHNGLNNNCLNSVLPPHLPLRVHHRPPRTAPLPDHGSDLLVPSHLRSSTRILLPLIPRLLFAIIRHFNTHAITPLQRRWRFPTNNTLLLPPLHPRHAPRQHPHPLSLHLHRFLSNHHPRHQTLGSHLFRLIRRNHATGKSSQRQYSRQRTARLGIRRRIIFILSRDLIIFSVQDTRLV